MVDGGALEADRGLYIIEPERLEEQSTLAWPILGQVLQAHLDQSRVLEIERISDAEPARIDGRQPGHDLP